MPSPMVMMSAMSERPTSHALIDRLPEETDRMARQLLQRACDARLTIATAESCTGGLIGALLTDVEGISHAFERGFITYTDEAKAGMLGIDRQLINEEGAVSEAVAAAMARGAIGHSSADVALAVTGFAGEAGPNDEPGLVHFACLRRGRDVITRVEHFGPLGRTEVRARTVKVALEMMVDVLD